MIHWRGVMLAMASAQDVTSTLTSMSLVSPISTFGFGGFFIFTTHYFCVEHQLKNDKSCNLEGVNPAFRK